MRKVIALISLLCVSFTAHALVVVDAGGAKDWRQVTDTLNRSSDQVGFSCSRDTGACTGDYEGWIWASDQEVAALFDALIHPESHQEFHFTNFYSSKNDPYVQDAIGDTGFRRTFWDTNFEAVYGITRTEGTVPLLGTLVDVYDPDGFDKARIYRDLSIVRSDEQSGVVGHWMYRAPPVPLPAAAWLLLSGVGALGAVVRRRPPLSATATSTARPAS